MEKIQKQALETIGGHQPNGLNASVFKKEDSLQKKTREQS